MKADFSLCSAWCLICDHSVWSCAPQNLLFNSDTLYNEYTSVRLPLVDTVAPPWFITHYSPRQPHNNIIHSLITFNFIPQNSSPNSIICHISMLQHCQHCASDLTMGRLHLWPVCPGSSRGLSAISCWLFRRGRLSSHLLLSSAPLPVIIEADTVPPWLPSYIASTTSTLPHPFPSAHPSTFRCVPYRSPKTFSPGQAGRKHHTDLSSVNSL